MMRYLIYARGVIATRKWIATVDVEDKAPALGSPFFLRPLTRSLARAPCYPPGHGYLLQKEEQAPTVLCYRHLS